EVPGGSATNTRAPSTVAEPCPRGETAHSGVASRTVRRAASVARNEKRTTSPARIAVSAGMRTTRATGLGVTSTVQLALVLPACAVTTARPAVRAVRRPIDVTSTTAGRLDFHVTWS